ncbi:MAG TPA: TIGR03809 family protein [Pseudolabrys sp.]|jgi:uncharacterized repeat protein (TIGR03809 family)|nr:TIGR03809 family protein [Pseudolabrys sp.]
MAAVQGGVRLDKIAQKWQALAQRRLAYMRELEQSGRWKRFYTSEKFSARLREAEQTAKLWTDLVSRPFAVLPGTRNVSPAA